MESLRLLRQAIHTVVRNGTFARFIPSGMIVISAAARRPALYRSRTLHSRSESMLPSVWIKKRASDLISLLASTKGGKVSLFNVHLLFVYFFTSSSKSWAVTDPLDSSPPLIASANRSSWPEKLAVAQLHFLLSTSKHGLTATWPVEM